MPKGAVAAHLIVGKSPEPVLPALLTSLSAFVDVVIVNENSGFDDSENLRALGQSDLFVNGRMVIDRSPFTDFSTARNRCLEIHKRIDAGPWVAFVDADEVHMPQAQAIAARLPSLPNDIATVDGYTRHFFQSPDWYIATDRRMSFFRFSENLRWEGNVHEQLSGLQGKRICLPYVYAHYGHLASTQGHAYKARLYSSLGAAGSIPSLEEIEFLQQETYFADYWPRLLRYRGAHPPAAAAYLAKFRAENRDRLAWTEHHIRREQGTLNSTVYRAYWTVNYALRWKSRWLTLPALRLCL